MKRFLILILLISLASPGFAQQKYERESQIQKEEVPETAISFVDSMQLNTKIRWYKEKGYNKTSYEAKTKHKGKKYSIEFSEAGSFEDVEIEINPKKIRADAYAEITKHLASRYDKYSIEKVQIQYSGDPKLVLAYFQNRGTISDILIHYEIVISAKVDGSYVMFEYLFSESGEFVQKAQIVLKITDNIEY